MQNTPHNEIRTCDFKVIMLRCFYVIARKPLLDERTVTLNAPVA
jgi:hypothetical protein